MHTTPLVVFAKRAENGLYLIIPGAMPPSPPPAVPTNVLLAVPVNVRRESVHRLHPCLGHASVQRMEQARAVSRLMYNVPVLW